MTLLDAIGPNEVLASSPKFNVIFASKTGLDICNDHRNLKLTGLKDIKNVIEADILLIPGGPGDHLIIKDLEVLEWIREVNKKTMLTTSVCTGSLILAKTGLLKNKKACSHWAFLDDLKDLGAVPVRKRFIQDGKYITASGVSAGIDLSLFILKTLVSKKHAKSIQFGIEYFPNKINMISSYTLPRFLLNKAATKVKKILEPLRKI